MMAGARAPSYAPSVKHVLLAATLWLAACSPTTIDRQEVGERICKGGASELVGELPCGQFADFARTLLDKEQPGHAPIRDVEVYRDLVFRQVSGYGQRVFVVLRLGDGTAQSHWVSCGRSMDKDWCGDDAG